MKSDSEPKKLPKSSKVVRDYRSVFCVFKAIF